MQILNIERRKILCHLQKKHLPCFGSVVHFLSNYLEEMINLLAPNETKNEKEINTEIQKKNK